MHSFERNAFTRVISSVLVVFLTISLILSPNAVYAQQILSLPVPGVMVMPTDTFVPVIIKGMTIHPDQPLKFDFIVDNGNALLEGDPLKEESSKLVKYFLASLTVPEKELWVNLSPNEKDRIIPDTLGKTQLGQDLLAQDYLLKQLTATLMYPEDELGAQFWNKVYEKAYAQYGTTDIPINTFNKVWIIPERASVYEHGNTVYVTESKLKVLTDQDYWLSQNIRRNAKDESSDYSHLTSEVIKNVIIPAIEKEVNEGENFAPLRQIYHSLILAKWYKETLHQSILNQVYSDQNKISGIENDDLEIKQKIYDQYIKAYKKGVYDYIRDEYDTVKREIVPRKYFSGGFKADVAMAINREDAAMPVNLDPAGNLSNVSVELETKGSGMNEDFAMIGTWDFVMKDVPLLMISQDLKKLRPRFQTASSKIRKKVTSKRIYDYIAFLDIEDKDLQSKAVATIKEVVTKGDKKGNFPYIGQPVLNKITESLISENDFETLTNKIDVWQVAFKNASSMSRYKSLIQLGGIIATERLSPETKRLNLFIYPIRDEEGFSLPIDEIAIKTAQEVIKEIPKEEKMKLLESLVSLGVTDQSYVFSEVNSLLEKRRLPKLSYEPGIVHAIDDSELIEGVVESLKMGNNQFLLHLMKHEDNAMASSIDIWSLLTSKEAIGAGIGLAGIIGVYVSRRISKSRPWTFMHDGRSAILRDAGSYDVDLIEKAIIGILEKDGLNVSDIESLQKMLRLKDSEKRDLADGYLTRKNKIEGYFHALPEEYAIEKLQSLMFDFKDEVIKRMLLAEEVEDYDFYNKMSYTLYLLGEAKGNVFYFHIYQEGKKARWVETSPARSYVERGPNDSASSPNHVEVVIPAEGYWTNEIPHLDYWEKRSREGREDFAMAIGPFTEKGARKVLDNYINHGEDQAIRAINILGKIQEKGPEDIQRIKNMLMSDKENVRSLAKSFFSQEELVQEYVSHVPHKIAIKELGDKKNKGNARVVKAIIDSLEAQPDIAFIELKKVVNKGDREVIDTLVKLLPEHLLNVNLLVSEIVEPQDQKVINALRKQLEVLTEELEFRYTLSSLKYLGVSVDRVKSIEREVKKEAVNLVGLEGIKNHHQQYYFERLVWHAFQLDREGYSFVLQPLTKTNPLSAFSKEKGILDYEIAQNEKLNNQSPVISGFHYTVTKTEGVNDFAMSAKATIDEHSWAEVIDYIKTGLYKEVFWNEFGEFQLNRTATWFLQQFKGKERDFEFIYVIDGREKAKLIKSDLTDSNEVVLSQMNEQQARLFANAVKDNVRWQTTDIDALKETNLAIYTALGNNAKYSSDWVLERIMDFIGLNIAFQLEVKIYEDSVSVHPEWESWRQPQKGEVILTYDSSQNDSQVIPPQDSAEDPAMAVEQILSNIVANKGLALGIGSGVILGAIIVRKSILATKPWAGQVEGAGVIIEDPEKYPMKKVEKAINTLKKENVLTSAYLRDIQKFLLSEHKELRELGERYLPTERVINGYLDVLNNPPSEAVADYAIDRLLHVALSQKRMISAFEKMLGYPSDKIRQKAEGYLTQKQKIRGYLLALYEQDVSVHKIAMSRLIDMGVEDVLIAKNSINGKLKYLKQYTPQIKVNDTHASWGPDTNPDWEWTDEMDVLDLKLSVLREVDLLIEKGLEQDLFVQLNRSSSYPVNDKILISFDAKYDGAVQDSGGVSYNWEDLEKVTTSIENPYKPVWEGLLAEIKEKYYQSQRIQKIESLVIERILNNDEIDNEIIDDKEKMWRYVGHALIHIDEGFDFKVVYQKEKGHFKYYPGGGGYNSAIPYGYSGELSEEEEIALGFRDPEVSGHKEWVIDVTAGVRIVKGEKIDSNSDLAMTVGIRGKILTSSLLFVGALSLLLSDADMSYASIPHNGFHPPATTQELESPAVIKTHNFTDEELQKKTWDASEKFVQAVIHNKVPILKKILEDETAYYAINARDMKGGTLLMYTIANHYNEAGRLLLEYGADVTILTYTRISSLMIAVRSENLPMATLLLENPFDKENVVDPNIVAWEGITAMYLAKMEPKEGIENISEERKEIRRNLLKLLNKHGAKEVDRRLYNEREEDEDEEKDGKSKEMLANMRTKTLEDFALTAEAPGGIDMNDIHVDRRGDGAAIQFDLKELPQIEMNQIEGFSPVIINITPIPSIYPLLGLADPRDTEGDNISVELSAADDPQKKIL